MRMSFHRIAYEALEVCNALEMPAVDAAVAAAGLPPGARALDIGTGNAAVAIRLAQGFGLQVTAVEGDPAMAQLAGARILQAGADVDLRRARSGEVLPEGPWDLIVAIGSTDAAGTGERTPRGILEGLAGHLAPGGRLLWGDLFWIGEPPAPLRQMVEATDSYLSHTGWQDAARGAGLEVERAEVSSDEVWVRYAAAMDGAVRAWLADHPTAPEFDAVQFHADRVRAMLEFGRPFLGFGLYLLRKP